MSPARRRPQRATRVWGTRFGYPDGVFVDLQQVRRPGCLAARAAVAASPAFAGVLLRSRPQRLIPESLGSGPELSVTVGLTVSGANQVAWVEAVARVNHVLRQLPAIEVAFPDSDRARGRP